MNSEWRKITFGNFISIQRGHDLPDQNRRLGNVPILGSFGITGFHDTAKSKGPGVTIGRSGASFGVAAYTDKDYWPLNTALYVTDFKGNDPRFVFYFLKQFDFSSFNSGSAQPSLNRNNLYPVLVSIPNPDEQKLISSFISALDDRIALLRETNTTLEAIAQALFKSWFVDFDPVRAKQQGREPEGMDPATAALFSDSFEESELGLVPRGWRVDSIYAAAKLIYGAPFASSKFNSEGIGKPLIRIRDLKDEAPGVFTSEVHPKGYLVRPGDIVVGMDGEFRAYLWGGEEAWLNQRVCVFSPVEEIPSVFIHRSIIPILAAVEAAETATTVIHLGKNDIDRFKIIMPSEKILTAFGEITNAIYKKIVEQKQMIRTLAALRDTLLPRLISGQLRLPDAVESIADQLTGT